MDVLYISRSNSGYPHPFIQEQAAAITKMYHKPFTKQKVERVYLIKTPCAWMIDELIVFSQHVKFKVLFLRDPDAFYKDRINQLKANGIEVISCPFTSGVSSKKIFFCLRFIIQHLTSFFSRYSFVVGVKSIWWFLKLDDTYFNKPVSIHAQFATQPALIALLLSKYHRKTPIDYFFTFHAYDIFFQNKWFTKLVNNSKKCFSISDYNIKYVFQKYKGLDASKIEISRLGAFANETVHKPRIKSNIFRLGFISWFVEKKGIRYLLEAMKNLAAQNKSIELMIAGDGPLRSEIEEYIIATNLTESIHYIGKLNFDEKESFFSHIDALVLPAITLHHDQDGIPVVLMEAISYGLPIISTNISGIPEICINNYNGFLVPERNTEALTEAILSLYNNRLLVKKFSENSLELFKDYQIERNSLNKLKMLAWIN